MSVTQQVYDFLAANEITLSFILLIGALVGFAHIEGARPRKTQTREQLRRRWPTNLGLMVVNQVNVSWVTAVSAVAVAWWSSGEEIGLLRRVDIDFWTATLLTLLTFELISYVYHRLLHAVPMLWRIHAVHHCDTEIDFTTTFRNHPLELLFVVPVSIPVVLAIGFPPASIVLYQLIRIMVLVFAHSNIRLPERLDAWLRLLITTPDYHRVHHSSDRYYTDSNFCPTFPVYDYLFGTARKMPYAQLPDMDLGLEYLRTPRQTGFINLVLMPFTWNKQGPRPGIEPSRA